MSSKMSDLLFSLILILFTKRCRRYWAEMEIFYVRKKDDGLFRIRSEIHWKHSQLRSVLAQKRCPRRRRWSQQVANSNRRLLLSRCQKRVGCISLDVHAARCNALCMRHWIGVGLVDIDWTGAESMPCGDTAVLAMSQRYRFTETLYSASLWPVAH